jgi:hypothetical protein
MHLERAAMKVSRIATICVCGPMILYLVMAAGCAKTEDEPVQTNNSTKSTTQPAVTAIAQANDSAESAPTASMLMVNHGQQWFGPARLRLTSTDGKVLARLYSQDPKDVLSGKETVNAYDIQMSLEISDPSAISNAVWVNRSSSMDRQEHPKVGIFLDTEHEVLQPMDVKVTFIGDGTRVRAVVQGTFAMFHVSEQMPSSAPEVVPVVGVLDAMVDQGK